MLILKENLVKLNNHHLEDDEFNFRTESPDMRRLDDASSLTPS